MMEPSWGFSLAVSGRTMPLLVISSRGVGWMTTRSPSGRSLVAVAAANADPSWWYACAWVLAVAVGTASAGRHPGAGWWLARATEWARTAGPGPLRPI